MGFFNQAIRMFTYVYPLYVIYIIREAQNTSQPDEEHEAHGDH
jgi:hypothetical protein